MPSDRAGARGARGEGLLSEEGDREGKGYYGGKKKSMYRRTWIPQHSCGPSSKVSQ